MKAYPELDLQVAYRISEEAAERPDAQLFWAMDRFYWDRDAVDECAWAQRSEAVQRCAKVLDDRGVPLRDPREAPAYPGQRPLGPR